MNTSDIIKLRLSNTGLLRSPFKNAADAVSHLGAVQAQDFTAAEWALGLRIRNSTDADIEKAFNEGRILRTHVMRPTWHFVMPEDIRWMLELTAPRVKAVLQPYNRKLELDEALFARSRAAIEKALRGKNYLTRQELKAVLIKIGIATGVQRLAHIISWAELDALICTGPKRGKQFTYALLEERAPKASKLDREQALDKLAQMYFASHGPAQMADFSWWSGLAMKDVRQAVDLNKSKLEHAIVDGKTYWFFPGGYVRMPKSPFSLLLSVYDEYVIAYKDRNVLSDARDVERMLSSGNASTSIIIIDGKAAGTWKKVINNDTAEIRLIPFRKLTGGEQHALASEVARYGKFVGLSAAIVE